MYDEDDRITLVDLERRCPIHHEIISNGVFDAPCCFCEGEGELEAMRWAYDPSNAHRPYCCIPEAYYPHGELLGMSCLDVICQDDIPF